MSTEIHRLHFEMLCANRQRLAKSSARRRTVKRISIAVIACGVLVIVALWGLDAPIGSYRADELYRRFVISLGRLVSWSWWFGDA